MTVLPGWSNNLKRLRSFGLHREAPSTAYVVLRSKLSSGDVLVDVGCGDSNDRFIAAQEGITAYGVDLFPPLERSAESFVRADIRRLPFADNSVSAIICQAVVALIPPDERQDFYAELARILKPDGWLSVLIQPLTDGWKIILSDEVQRIADSGFHSEHGGLYRKEINMSEALATIPKEEQSAVHLVARNPVEMQNAQADLGVWLKNKIVESKIEIKEMGTAISEARDNNWATAALTRQRNKALGRFQWYFKLLTAVESGFTIIPEFPIEVFAIRVTRTDLRAPGVSREGGWGWPTIRDERPDVADVGEGEYKNPVQLVRHNEYKEVKDGKEIISRYTHASKWQDEVAFPLRAARPAVMNATAQAMALKVFDQIGICLPVSNSGGTSARAPDPLIIGQVLGKREGWGQKCASFIIAWHVDLRTL